MQRVAAYALVRRGDEVLLTRISATRRPHRGLDPARRRHRPRRAPAAALVREVREESGLDVRGRRPARRARRALHRHRAVRARRGLPRRPPGLRRDRRPDGASRVSSRSTAPPTRVAWVALGDVIGGRVAVDRRGGLRAGPLRRRLRWWCGSGQRAGDRLHLRRARAEVRPRRLRRDRLRPAPVRRAAGAAWSPTRAWPRPGTRSGSPTRCAQFGIEAVVFDGAHVEPTDESMQRGRRLRPRRRAVGRVRRGRRRLGDRHRQGGQPAHHQPRRADGLRQRPGRQGAQRPSSRCKPLVAVPTTTGTGARAPRSACSTCSSLQGEDRHQPRRGCGRPSPSSTRRSP